MKLEQTSSESKQNSFAIDEVSTFIERKSIVDILPILEKLEWGDKRGSFEELKQEWIDPPIGFNKTIFRSRLKALVSTLGKKKDKHPAIHLTPPPFIPEFFLGRETDIQIIYQKLTQYDNLLFINGQGGIGKTTLAARYWQEYQDLYSHVAWVFADNSLLDAMLTLAEPLNLSFHETMPNHQRLPLLLKALNNLDKPCLMVIDNANKLEDLEEHYLALRSCSNFHLLLTTRITEFEQATFYAIQPLKNKAAIKLFHKHYPKYKPSDWPQLKQILQAVDYNTLIIELLSKNLNNLNKLKEQYSLEDLWMDIQNNSLLKLKKSGQIKTSYGQKSGALHKAAPEAIIGAMYDLGELSPEEKKLLSIFSVLPAEKIEYEILNSLLLEVEGLEHV